MAATENNEIASGRTRTPRAPSRERQTEDKRKAAAVPKRNAQHPLPSVRTPQVTKNARLIELLTCDHGMDITALSLALGWQSHTIRAALTRLRQSGHRLEATASPGGGGKLYRIPTQEAAE